MIFHSVVPTRILTCEVERKLAISWPDVRTEVSRFLGDRMLTGTWGSGPRRDGNTLTHLGAVKSRVILKSRFREQKKSFDL